MIISGRKAHWRDIPISAREALLWMTIRSGATMGLFMDRKISIRHLPIPVTVHLRIWGLVWEEVPFEVTAEDLLFNKALPLNSYKTSKFTLENNSPNPLVMQTSIGQGNTLVSPMHMAMITSAIANNGVLMKPTMIDKIVNNSGDTIKETEKSEYKRLMTNNEANILGKLMKNVVENGTASALNGRGYTVAGKTGSAEFDENGSSHSWFVGYSNVDDPDIAIAVIVENGGTGSEAAVPIAADVFDAYYFD